MTEYLVSDSDRKYVRNGKWEFSIDGIANARITACRYAKKTGRRMYILAREGPWSGGDERMWIPIENIDYDGKSGEYYILTRGKLRRVSPKTGGLLDYNSNFKWM